LSVKNRVSGALPIHLLRHF